MFALKTAAVCRWIFTLLGAAAGDTLDDLFPARVRWAGRGPGWRANLWLLGWETGQVVADMGGIPMNAPNDNTAPKGLRGSVAI